MRTENKKTNMIAMICIILCVITILVVMFQMYFMYRHIDELKYDVNQLTTEDVVVVDTEFSQAIDFLETEIEKYRAFVERQQDFIISMVCVLGSGLLVLAGFFSIKSKKDVDLIIEEQYKDVIKNEIARAVGGSEKEKYLRDSINREENAKSKKVVFIYEQADKQNIRYVDYEHVFKMIYNQDFYVEMKDINHNNFDTYQLGRYDILIYMVSEEELQAISNGESVDTLFYNTLASYANNNRKYCLLYTPSSPRLNFTDTAQKFNTSWANTGITLLQLIFSLLYNI